MFKKNVIEIILEVVDCTYMERFFITNHMSMWNSGSWFILEGGKGGGDN